MDERVGARGLVEAQRRTRRGPHLDLLLERFKSLGLVRLARREDDVQDIVAHLLVAIDLLQRLAQLDDGLGRGDGLDLGRLRLLGEALHDATLVAAAGRLHEALEHEAVHLRLGERIGPLLLDRVLGGQHEERIGQRVGRLADRHLALLHRFQERALHLRGRAVDFVRQQQIREHGTLLRRELTRLGRIDERAHHVGRQQVRGEGNTLEIHAQRLGERIDAERLREARHAFQKNMPVRDQRQHQPVDQLLLADNHLADLFLDFRHQLALRGDAVRCICQIHVLLLLSTNRYYITFSLSLC